MMMKNEPKINRGTVFHFSTICPTISGVKNLLINEYDFLERLQNGRKVYLIQGKCQKKYS